ncbi:MAG: TonB-dependent receptor [Gemmatimonadetes bacterium]|nr:TonB-dependent receptor [Gemmatimonadota bacterium]
MKSIARATAMAVAAACWAGTLNAQQFPAERAAEARAAVEACSAAGGRKDEAAARPAAQRASALLAEWLRAEPRAVEPRVRMANLRAGCELPFADMMGQGTLIGQANTLLEEALQIDSTHWEARFTLAMHHFHTPEFLGRGPEAIRHLEILLRQQGEGPRPNFARAYLVLGDLYRRGKREEDALAVWRRGAALFPDNVELRARLGGTPAGAVAAAGREGGPALALAPIVVEAGTRMDDTRSQVALKRVDVLVTPGGTADIMQAFQTGPGATRAGEGSDLYVRGGDPAESPVFVDGARLFYPGRYETLNGASFGILDAQVLDAAYFSSGGFGARYGNALSGVLDVRTIGRPDTRTVRLNANTVQAGTRIDLPTSPNTGAWASLRATDARLMMAMHGRDGEFQRAPAAVEGMAGAVWEPRAGSEVKLVALADEDVLAREVDAHGWTGPFESRGSNRLASLSARTLLAGDRVALRGTVSGSRRSTHFTFGVLDRERTDRGAVGRVDADVSLPGGGRVSFGAEGAWMDATEAGRFPSTDRLSPGAPTMELDEGADARHVGGYLEAERALSPSLALIAGVRADRLPGERSWTTDPRLALAYRTGEWTLRFGGGLFHQGRWRTKYQVPDGGTPGGIPTRAEHLVAGAERAGDPSLKVEGYVKRYGGYAQDGDGPAIEAGRAAGMDAIVRWSGERRLSGWITYSFLEGQVDLQDGGGVPSAVDVRHSLTGVARWRVRPMWELGSTLRLGSGRPFTDIGGGRTEADGRISPIYGAVHGSRLPGYARLDGRISRYLPMRAGIGIVYLEMLNLLDRKNVQGYTYSEGYAERRPVHSYFSQRTLVLGLGLTF